MIEKFNLFFGTIRERPLNFIRTNLNLIVLIPAILGGVWQIIALASISFSCVRFFSITQIIPDGLIILLLLFIISFFLFLYSFTLKGYVSLSNNIEVKSKNTLLSKIIANTITILFFIIFAFINSETYDFYLFIQFYKYSIFLLLSIIIGIIIPVYFLHLIKVNSQETQKVVKRHIFLTFAFLIGFYSVKYIGAVMQPNKNLKNLDNIVLYNNIQIASRLIYYNDKYIFLEELDLNKFRKTKKIYLSVRVLKIDNLFPLTSEVYKPNLKLKKEVLNAFKYCDSVDFSKINKYSTLPIPYERR